MKDGHTVKVVDNDLRGSSKRLADVLDDIQLINCDVRDADAMSDAAAGCESILHLAALNGTENFYNRPDVVLDVGIRGMYGALEAARRNGITEFVLASSSEAYQTPPMVPTPEDVPLTIPDPWNPRYSYGGSKLISEIMLANYNRDVFKKAIIFRPHNVYGADMGWEHVIPQLVLRAQEQIAKHPDRQGALRDPGRRLADPLLHLHRRFHRRPAGRSGQGRAPQRLPHRHDGRTVDPANWSRRSFAWFGREPEIIAGPAPAGGTPRRCPDIAKLAALGFAPKVPLAEGVAGVAAWYVENAHMKPKA